MRDDSGQGHVQRLAHIDDGPLVQQNGLDEVVRQLPMRAPMAAGPYARRQRWTISLDVLVVWLLPIDAALVLLTVHLPQIAQSMTGRLGFVV